MPTNLTGSKISDTYSQLLHLSGGPEAAEKTVYSGAGVATAFKLSIGSVSVDNIRLDGSTISSVTNNSNLTISPAGTGYLATGNMAFRDNTIFTTDVDGDLVLEPNGSGAVSIANVNITGGSITGVVFTGSFTGITLIESQAFHTVNGGDGLQIEHTGITAAGTGTNIDIELTPKGSGGVVSTGKLGYATGVGGSVTQLTNKATGVTLNALSGKITMSNAILNRNTGVSFTLTNSYIGANDVVLANIVSGATAATYTISVDAVSAGSCVLHLHNHSTGVDLSEAVVLNFIVLKGDAS